MLEISGATYRLWFTLRFDSMLIFYYVHTILCVESMTGGRALKFENLWESIQFDFLWESIHFDFLWESIQFDPLCGKAFILTFCVKALACGKAFTVLLCKPMMCEGVTHHLRFTEHFK